jgi:hypothetical protein
MKRLTVGAISVTVLMILFAFGASYAQQRAEHGGASAPVEVLEVFCNHLGTGQLCPGSNATAKLFNLSGAKKDRYVEAINIYNKAVAAAAQCGQVIMETRIMKLPLKACNQYSRGENRPLAKVSQLGVNIELLR